MKALRGCKAFLTEHLRGAVFLLLVIQPMLDVLSYWMAELGSTTLTTLLRFALLGAVALLGFIVTEKKRAYLCIYGVMAGFWALHAANCLRVGYISFYQDTANFLRTMSLPVFLLSMMTFLTRDKGIAKVICAGVAVNLLEVVVFTALPWLLGQPVYTYELIQVGVMGWFGVANAQSAIIVLLVPMAVFWGYRSGKYWAFLLAAGAGFLLMFLTGTKLTFYSIFIVAGAFIFLLVLNLKKKCFKYVVPLAVVFLAAALLRGQSPMQVREGMSAYAQGNYQQLVAESIRSSGASAEELAALQQGEHENWEAVRQLREGLAGVYADRNVYGPLYKDLYDRFGLYNVMESYDYTSDTSILSDSRVRKSAFADMIWREKDLWTHLLGFEYSDMLYGDAIYDLENDFPALFYFYGYVGFALYLLLFGFIAWTVLSAFAGEVRAAAVAGAPKGGRFRRGLGAFFGGIGRFLTIETGAVGMTFLLAVIAAQLSGNVLRRPNVAVYMAVAAAYLWLLCRERHTQEKTAAK